MDEIDYLTEIENQPPEPFRFACSVITTDQAELLTKPSICQIAADKLTEIVAQHQGQLWGFVVLPNMVQFVVQVEQERNYHVLVEAYKSLTNDLMSERIQEHYPQFLDDILRLNPQWGGAIYRVWQDGYHTQALHSFYAISNRVADMINKPVELGLVEKLGDWEFSSYQAADEDE